jgi:dual specificity phosphatase 3
MANISYVTDRIWTGGDLPSHLGEAAMLTDLACIQASGITHILDNRIEWSDEAFVEAHAPAMTYWWNGQDDAGQAMPDEWFYDGVDYALEALKNPNAQVLAHCHMGINRGPSMAFAILLATGMEPVPALAAIRQARPIAAISYADDALDWWHRMTETPAVVAKLERAEVAAWHRRNPIDVVRIIRTIRSHEDDGRPLSA